MVNKNLVVEEERVQCKKCPITYICRVPKEDRWRDLLNRTAKVSDCPIVAVLKLNGFEIG